MSLAPGIPAVRLAAALLIALRLAGALILSALNRAEVRRHAGRPPAAVSAIASCILERKADVAISARHSSERYPQMAVGAK